MTGQPPLLLLFLLMFAVTYASRAVPLLVPGIERLPRVALDYLRLVGPAALAALAVVNTAITRDDGRSVLHVGIEWVAVAVCVALVAWRRNLFLGLAAATLLVALSRAVGIAGTG